MSKFRIIKNWYKSIVPHYAMLEHINTIINQRRSSGITVSMHENAYTCGCHQLVGALVDPFFPFPRFTFPAACEGQSPQGPPLLPLLFQAVSYFNLFIYMPSLVSVVSNYLA